MRITKYAIYIIMLMCAACNLNQQTTSRSLITPTAVTVPTDAPLATPDVTSSTYTNSTYGYSLQYPAGLELEGGADSQYVWINKQIFINVSDTDPEKAQGDGPVIEQAQTAMIGQFTARRLSGYIGAVGGNIPQRYEAFVIAHNNLYYQFTAYELKQGDVQPPDRIMNPVPPEVVDLLSQIVTSLRFTS